MVIKGLTDSGFLLAWAIHRRSLILLSFNTLTEDKAGVQFELSPDGNSLDFFSGLIKRKL